jgi:hypothetical protein
MNKHKLIYGLIRWMDKNKPQVLNFGENKVSY